MFLEHMQWLFNGIGTAIITAILGIVGYKFYKNQISQDNNQGINNVGNNNISIIHNNNGITEERATEIFYELHKKVIEEYSIEANELAIKRSSEFCDLLINNLKEYRLFEEFKLPEFQIMLKYSQAKVILTDRKEDYDLIATLLVLFVKNKNDRNYVVNIRGAIDLIPYIDPYALTIISIIYLIRFIPNKASIKKWLKKLDKLMGLIINEPLDNRRSWISNLETLNLGKILDSSCPDTRQIKDFYKKDIQTGIREGSKEYFKAIELLKSIGLNEKSLVKNDLVDGYVLLDIDIQNTISQEDVMVLNNIEFFIFEFGMKNRSEKEIATFIAICDLYDNIDKNKKYEIEKNFEDLWNRFENLHKVDIWWKEMPAVFSMNNIAKAIAYVNIKNIYNEIPKLIF